MAAHRIQLRGPWEVETLDPSAVLPSRVQLPCTWAAAFGEFSGPVRLKRRFHRPTNLDPTDHVRLVVVAPGQAGRFTLNGRSLGTFVAQTGESSFEIGDGLLQTNQMIVELQPPESGSSLFWQTVAIEIASE